MSISHEHFGFNYIELYTLLQQTLPSQQSQIIDQSEYASIDSDEVEDEAEDINSNEVEAEVNILDEEEKESEIKVDYLLNTNAEDDDHQASLSLSHVYCSPQHMTNLNLDDDEPFYDVFLQPVYAAKW